MTPLPHLHRPSESVVKTSRDLVGRSASSRGCCGGGGSWREPSSGRGVHPPRWGWAWGGRSDAGRCWGSGHRGVLASAWVLDRGGGPPFAGSLASLLLAKLLEFGALVATTAALALLAHLRGVGGVIVRPMLWAGVVALVVFVVALA